MSYGYPFFSHRPQDKTGPGFHERIIERARNGEKTDVKSAIFHPYTFLLTGTIALFAFGIASGSFTEDKAEKAPTTNTPAEISDKHR